MITVDGSYLEGGGQILRTAIALSSITGKSACIDHIRAGRKAPGLRPQHLKGIQGAAEITGAKVEGVYPGSAKVFFSPGRIRGGSYEIDAHTAAAITLILQELLPIGLFADDAIKLILRGGTAVPFSPTVEYQRHIMCFFLKLMGASVELKALQHGFYPKGGGKASVSVEPSELHGIELTTKGALQQVDVAAFASQELQAARVAERMIDGFREVIPDAKSRIFYSVMPHIGCFLNSHAHYAQTRVGADGLGKRGKRAEDIGRETARNLSTEMDSPGAIDSWMVDQLIIYLALAAYYSGHSSRIRIPILTPHAETTIWVVKHFLDIKIEVEDFLLSVTPLQEK